MLEVRPATLNDVRGIVAVHTAGEDFSGLSVRERYWRGGPWMSVETLAIHLNNLLLDGQLVAVAELNGKIVGEVEVLFSEEPIKGEIRRIGHVDVIEVHPDYRRTGVGRALMEFVEDIAREREAEMLTAQPEEETRGFYKKLGFEEVLYENWVVEVDTADFEAKGTKALKFFSWETVRELELVAGRFQSSYDMWFSSFKDVFAGVHELAEAGTSGGSYYVLKHLPGRPGKASLFLWGSSKDVESALGRAKELGFEKVLMTLDEETAERLGAEKKGRVQIIGKGL